MAAIAILAYTDGKYLRHDQGWQYQQENCAAQESHDLHITGELRNSLHFLHEFPEFT